MVRGRFVPAARKNIAAGFHDEEGIFHPIRASFDYDPARGGDRARKARPKAKVKKKPKARKKAKARPVKKAKAKKRKTSRKGAR